MESLVPTGPFRHPKGGGKRWVVWFVIMRMGEEVICGQQNHVFFFQIYFLTYCGEIALHVISRVATPMTSISSSLDASLLSSVKCILVSWSMILRQCKVSEILVDLALFQKKHGQLYKVQPCNPAKTDMKPEHLQEKETLQRPWTKPPNSNWRLQR